MDAKTKHDEMLRQVIEALESLPTGELAEVASFVEFQRFKREHPEQRDTPYRPVTLGGLWKGVQISEEDLADVRREMWGNFGIGTFERVGYGYARAHTGI